MEGPFSSTLWSISTSCDTRRALSEKEPFRFSIPVKEAGVQLCSESSLMGQLAKMSEPAMSESKKQVNVYIYIYISPSPKGGGVPGVIRRASGP